MKNHTCQFRKIVALVLFPLLALACYWEAPEPSPITTEDTFGQQLQQIYPQVLDYLIASRLANVTAEMASEALAYRIANLSPDPVTKSRTHNLLARSLAYQQRFSEAARAFGEAKEQPMAKELSSAFASLAENPATEIVGANLDTAARSFYCLTQGRHPSVLEHARQTKSVDALENVAFSQMTDPSQPFEGDPVEFLPDFAGQEFCEYDPLSLAYLSRLYARKLRQAAPSEASDLVRWILGEGPPPHSTDMRNETRDLIWLVLSTCSSCTADQEFLTAISSHYGTGNSAYHHAVQGYLFLADNELEAAWSEFQEAVQMIPEISEPRSDVTSLVLIDFVSLSYRLRRVNYARRWILGGESVRDSFPFLKIPYFYLTWMQREGLIT